MDTPPVNRLLQLLRQKPSDPPAQPQPAPAVSPRRKRSPTPAPESGTQYATNGGTQPATSGTQYATESGTPPKIKSGTQYATGNNIPLAVIGLSKGQRRVLQFLLANREPHNPSRTVLIGYHTISTYCFLSRNGSRKIIEQLCKKGLVRRGDTQRGGVQGSVYLLESSIQYTTKNGTPDDETNSEKSSTQHATENLPCSSKELLLQDLLFEDAFRDLTPRSLEPYLKQFETTEDLQNFLDTANACITAAKEGHGKSIQNPHGFLFAQLRAGYINPPEGYKSRKIRAQELKNRHLEEELATLRRLKEREQELQFELFTAGLTEEEQERLEQEARSQIQPNIGLSEQFQIEMHKEVILKQWFAQREKL